MITGERKPVAAFEYTSNQTDTVLVAAPGVGRFIKVYDIIVVTGTEGNVLLESGADTRWAGRWPLLSGGGLTHSSVEGMDVPENTALTITTTTGAGPLAITIGYVIIRSQ
jgi:hypothetical protein